MKEILLDEQRKIKERILTLTLDDKGMADEKVTINGFLEFIQLKKQIEGVGSPMVTIISDKLVEPILSVTLEKSAIYPVRTLNSDVKGNALAELNYQHSKIPLNDELTLLVTNGTPRNKLEVLIRYA